MSCSQFFKVSYEKCAVIWKTFFKRAWYGLANIWTSPFEQISFKGNSAARPPRTLLCSDCTHALPQRLPCFLLLRWAGFTSFIFCTVSHSGFRGKFSSKIFFFKVSYEFLKPILWSAKVS